MRPTIEVIIAAYNAQGLISETLESVLAQGPDVLIHVVDDGSSDNTEASVRPYLPTDQVTYQRQAQSGGLLGIPRNAPLARIQAPYVAFFDADDLMLPGHLKRQIAFLNEHLELDATSCNWQNFDHAGDYPRTHFENCPKLQARFVREARAEPDDKLLVLESREVKKLLTEENFTITGAFVLRTSFVRTLAGFDETLKGSEDFDFAWRALSSGTVGISSSRAFRRRFHANNLSNNLEKILHWKVISRMNLLDAEIDLEVRASLERAIARFLDDLAAAELAQRKPRAFLSGYRALRIGGRHGILPTHFVRTAVKALMGRDGSNRPVSS